MKLIKENIHVVHKFYDNAWSQHADYNSPLAVKLTVRNNIESHVEDILEDNIFMLIWNTSNEIINELTKFSRQNTIDI